MQKQVTSGMPFVRLGPQTTATRAVQGFTPMKASLNLRWILYSIAPAIFLSWIFSGCGKDSSIQISKNELQSSPASYRVRVALKLEGKGQSGGGAIRYADGTPLLSNVSSTEITLQEGADLALQAVPARGWKVKGWQIFSADKTRSDRVDTADLNLRSIKEDALIELVLEEKKTVWVKIRVGGPDIYAGKNSYNGYVQWFYYYTDRNDFKGFNRCHPSGKPFTPIAESTCKFVEVPRGVKVEVTAKDRQGYESVETYTMDDDLELDFEFTDTPK